jgi:hypothetical protein
MLDTGLKLSGFFQPGTLNPACGVGARRAQPQAAQPMVTFPVKDNVNSVTAI